MKTIQIPGKIRSHKVLLYALSTCAYCKRAKNLLAEGHIHYEYVDVDLCSIEDREEIRKDILRRGGRLSFPTLIIDDDILITGFQEDRIREALGS